MLRSILLSIVELHKVLQLTNCEPNQPVPASSQPPLKSDSETSHSSRPFKSTVKEVLDMLTPSEPTPKFQPKKQRSRASKEADFLLDVLNKDDSPWEHVAADQISESFPLIEHQEKAMGNWAKKDLGKVQDRAQKPKSTPATDMGSEPRHTYASPEDPFTEWRKHMIVQKDDYVTRNVFLEQNTKRVSTFNGKNWDVWHNELKEELERNNCWDILNDDVKFPKKANAEHKEDWIKCQIDLKAFISFVVDENILKSLNALDRYATATDWFKWLKSEYLVSDVGQFKHGVVDKHFEYSRRLFTIQGRFFSSIEEFASELEELSCALGKLGCKISTEQQALLFVSKIPLGWAPWAERFRRGLEEELKEHGRIAWPTLQQVLASALKYPVDPKEAGFKARNGGGEQKVRQGYPKNVPSTVPPAPVESALLGNQKPSWANCSNCFDFLHDDDRCWFLHPYRAPPGFLRQYPTFDARTEGAAHLRSLRVNLASLQNELKEAIGGRGSHRADGLGMGH